MVVHHGCSLSEAKQSRVVEHESSSVLVAFSSVVGGGDRLNGRGCTPGEWVRGRKLCSRHHLELENAYTNIFRDNDLKVFLN
jgi:hypothetical protein